MDNKTIKNNAVSYFNSTWDYIEKNDRTSEDNLKMIDFAFKSKYYWSLIGTELNFVRSDWQIARVFCEANLLEAALYYSNKCLEDTLKNEFGDFDLFFAYETNVRTYHLLGETVKRDEFIKKAKDSIELIKEKGDKDYCLSELNKILDL